MLPPTYPVRGVVGDYIDSCIIMDNFGIQVDADNKFNGDECANLKWPVGYHHCRKHPHSYSESVVSKSHPKGLRSR